MYLWNCFIKTTSLNNKHQQQIPGAIFMLLSFQWTNVKSATKEQEKKKKKLLLAQIQIQSN